MGMKDISLTLGDHYSKTFQEYGATPKGVDWGDSIADHALRLDRMLAVLQLGAKDNPSMLDIGCGYGSLLDVIKERGYSIDFHGVDICPSMIEFAKSKHEDAKWTVGDVLDTDFPMQFDYVVCNGILAQKLGTSNRDMDKFLITLIKKMFNLARTGIAFNVMTTHVNYMVDNLYYRNPVELLGWCMSELSSHIRLDHAYPLYEYTLYLYKDTSLSLPNSELEVKRV